MPTIFSLFYLVQIKGVDILTSCGFSFVKGGVKTSSVAYANITFEPLILFPTNRHEGTHTWRGT